MRRLAPYLFGAVLALGVGLTAIETVAVYRIAVFKSFARAYTAGLTTLVESVKQ
jgi:hypothetical protein